MLSLSPPIPKPTLKLSKLRHHRHRSKPATIRINSSRLPSPPPPPPPGADLYQPFRPPPSPLPAKYRSLDPLERIDVLRNRLGIWYEYAPLIASLSNDGFTPSSIEELTGITGVDQNRLVVGARVRDSLLTDLPPDLIPAFDATSAADLLYELRLLNNNQRVAAAQYLVERHLEAKSALELSRAIKDFPRRRGDAGWEKFSPESPADCLAYTYFRLSREAIDVADKLSWLDKAMGTVETELARNRIEEEREKVSGKGAGAEKTPNSPNRQVPTMSLVVPSTAVTHPLNKGESPAVTLSFNGIGSIKDNPPTQWRRNLDGGGSINGDPLPQQIGGDSPPQQR